MQMLAEEWYSDYSKKYLIQVHTVFVGMKPIVHNIITYIYLCHLPHSVCLSSFLPGAGVPRLSLFPGAGERWAQVYPLPEDGSRERREWLSFYILLYNSCFSITCPHFQGIRIRMFPVLYSDTKSHGCYVRNQSKVSLLFWYIDT